MTHWIATHPSSLAAAIALALLWLAESAAPFFTAPRARTAHGARNVTLGLINGLARAAFFPAALLAIAAFGEDRNLGLFRWLGLPAWGAAVAAVLFLDLVNYAWHIASHQWPFLWRFHAVHHHDDEVDATTAFRFHAGDVILNAVIVLLAVAALGLRVEHVLLYEAILLPLSIFHHGNIALPEHWDRPLRAVLVTPRMHWVHHSRWHEETDSNYSGIFSFWDRLFGTFRLRADPATLIFGLDGYSQAIQATLRGCMLTPFGPITSQPGRDPRADRTTDPAGLAARSVPAVPRTHRRPISNEVTDASGHSPPLASPSTHPSRGRHLPLALAVFEHTPAPGRHASGAPQRAPRATTEPSRLRPCPTQPPQHNSSPGRAVPAVG